MRKTAALSYIAPEIRSYLPSGWSLGAGVAGPSQTGAWRVQLLDPADLEWQLEVHSEDAARLGRLEALAAAMERLCREALK